MKKIGYISGNRIKGPVNLGPGGSINAPGGFIGGFSYGFGNIYYVDAVTGLDSNSGESPQAPLLTLAAAYAKCVDGHEDYIVVRGNFGEAITIQKSKLHLIGLLGGYGQSQLSRISSPAASVTGATILIQALDVEIANLQAMGLRDVGKHYPAIFADGGEPGHDGSRSYIHDVVIPMMTPSATLYCTGIHLVGNRHTVEHALIENSDIGILIDEDGGVPTHRTVLSDIIMRACNVGLHVFAEVEAVGQSPLMAADLFIDGAQAFAPDRAIKLDGTSGHDSFLRAHMQGYGNEAATITKGNGKYTDCTFAGATGISTPLT